jgi:hypothetical protein
MDTDRLLAIGALGIHLLFDTPMIVDAFRQDADELQRELAGRMQEVHFAIDSLVAIADTREARRVVSELAPPVRHLLVLVYFEMIDGHLKQQAPALH